MYRVGRDGLAGFNLRYFGVDEGDTAVYVFGEIDVRCHIVKQRDLQRASLEEIVEQLAENYIQTILDNQSQYTALQSVVYNVVPPIKWEVFSPEFPFYGTAEERIESALLLNAALKKLCERHKLFFLDVYEAYSDENGSLRTELSDGNVHIHLAHNAKLKEELHKIVSCRPLRKLESSCVAVEESEKEKAAEAPEEQAEKMDRDEAVE